MLRSAPSARLLRALQASIEDRRLVCSFCAKRKTLKTRQAAFSTRITPITAANAPKPVSENFKDLHEALIAFGRSASTYVNATQLQLALKSLENKDSTTRVAILGVNDRSGPLQLVQTLLADPLSPEASWEKELAQAQHDSKPLLIRAGLKTAIDSSHPLLRTLTIPSTLLAKHKVEIFVNHIVADPEVPLLSYGAALSELVVPNLQARESLSGRTSSVIFPVHRTVVFENGLQTTLDIASLLRPFKGKTISRMVYVAANVEWETLPNQEAGVRFVNLPKGQHSIRTIRDSLQNAVTYEREWLSSGLPSLVSLALPETSDSTTLKSTTRDLINHILEETELIVDASEAEATVKQSLLDLSPSSKQDLRLDISRWAEQAHTEFRAEMATILESRIWRKLAWWKLFWRIDDVQTVISEAIRRAYLVEAEKNSIFLAGRFAQAGLAEVVKPPKDNSNIFADSRSQESKVESATAPTKIIASSAESKSTLRPEFAGQQSPWPANINTSRLSIIHEKLPPLVLAAQGYVLSALSITGLTSLASALAYLSIPTTTLYEAGTFAAVGLVLSAYRLQSKWFEARRDWIRDVQVEGKRALDAVEQSFNTAVSKSNQSERDENDIRTEQEARHAIAQVRMVLEGIDNDAQHT